MAQRRDGPARTGGAPKDGAPKDGAPDPTTLPRGTLRRRIAKTTLRTLQWGERHVPVGVRSLVGVLLMVGGVFGFLPIVGFWMLPLGVAFIALDIPWTRHHIHNWMARLEGRLGRRGG